MSLSQYPSRFSHSLCFSFTSPPTTEIYTLSLHDALPICPSSFSCIKSIPDDPSVSQLQLGEARSRTSLARSVLACPFSPSDRKSTRLNSSHGSISYAVFCLKKKKA